MPNKWVFQCMLILFLSFVECVFSEESKTALPENHYLGGEYQGNYVWGAAMNLAWNDLCENLLHENLKLASEDHAALLTAENFNQKFFTKEDLDEKSYYIKSGQGQETVDLINKESRRKFPEKSFSDLKMKIRSKDIIAYAYFLKQVEYVTPFEALDVEFEGIWTKGFEAVKEEQKENISLLKYWNDEKFIIQLELEDKSDELILAKGFDMQNPSQVLESLAGLNPPSAEKISKDDIFRMPNLHLNHHRDYTEMIGQVLANQAYQGYVIAQMFENIKFDMDHKGARVENEAVIAVRAGAHFEVKKRRLFILNRPFWVIMKRRGSIHPYFILGARNSHIMEKA